MGLLWWMLAREVVTIRGKIKRATGLMLDDKEIMPDLYFYRDPEEVHFGCSSHLLEFVRSVFYLRQRKRSKWRIEVEMIRFRISGKKGQWEEHPPCPV